MKLEVATEAPPEISQRRSPHRTLLLEGITIAALLLLVIFVLPPVLSGLGQGFRINLLGRYMALAIVALGIDLIWGYTGLLSLGHGIFFALGGYGIAMHLQLQIPPGELPEFFTLFNVPELPWFWKPFYSFPFTLAAIVVIPTLVGAILGYIVFRNRIRGVYFSILTQAALVVFFNFFNGQQELINGTNGLKTDTTEIFGQVVSSSPVQYTIYILTACVLTLVYLLCRWLTSGRFGRLLVAIRDDESRVRFTGYNPTEFKVLVFAVSAALGGISGALFTLQSGIISPEAMSIAASIEMVIWVAVGGRASLVGAILGTLLVNFAKSLLSEQFPGIWLFFQGALFLIVVMVLPSGLVGSLRDHDRDQILTLLGWRRRSTTYPSLEENPEVAYERENPGN